MTDLDRPSRADIIASAAGGTVGPLVTGLLAMAAAVTHSPDLAVISIPAGAAADALTEHGFQRVTQAIRFQLAAERVSRFAEAVSEASGQPMDEFIDEHVTDSNQREFLGHAVDAAIAARSDWKIRLLARAFVRGATDGDLIDETEMFIKAVRDLEPAHARVLAATYSLFVRESSSRIVVTAGELRLTDGAIGPAAPLLWRSLRESDLIEAVDANTNGSKGLGLGTQRQYDTFRLTDHGIAVSEWLQGLGVELDNPGTASNGSNHRD